ncbi:MAG: cysteine desulfurase [Clostridia bacterium]|nr:cysteine desulfurase [Clostridia bacterium]
MIYLDNAATTPLDGEVLTEMLPYLKENYGNSSSQHALGRKSAHALLCARDGVAKILGCKSEEVYFTSGGTECANWAVKGVCAAHGKGHLIVSAIEHPSVIESAKEMQKLGFDTTFILPDKDGVIQPEAVEKVIRTDTVFCAVMHANNETGVIQPVEKIGGLCRGHGIFYFCDCVQTAGLMPLPVKFCDALSVSAHKFYGPCGIGAMYIKEGAKIQRLVSGGRQERSQRGGTVNVAAAAGLAKAFEAAVKGAGENGKRTAALRDSFVKRVLAEIPDTKMNGGGEKLPSHANISFGGCDGENLLFLLDLAGVAVSTGSACSAGAVTPSHVLTAMGLSERQAKSAVRFTFGKYNTEQEVEETLKILKECVSKIRGLNK